MLAVGRYCCRVLPAAARWAATVTAGTVGYRRWSATSVPSSYPRTPPGEIQHRLRRLREIMVANRLEGALFHGATSCFYYTGSAQQMTVWVPVAGDPLTIWARRDVGRARSESSLPDSAEFRPLRSLRELCTAVGHRNRVGVEIDIMPVTLFNRFQQAGLEVRDVVDIGRMTRELRAVKSEHELGLLREAGHAAGNVFEEIMNSLREGMTELDLSIIADSAKRFHGMHRIASHK